MIWFRYVIWANVAFGAPFTISKNAPTTVCANSFLSIWFTINYIGTFLILVLDSAIESNNSGLSLHNFCVIFTYLCYWIYKVILAHIYMHLDNISLFITFAINVFISKVYFKKKWVMNFVNKKTKRKILWDCTEI
jgi:hypothetical protein